jgi:hypothetical protein
VRGLLLLFIPGTFDCVLNLLSFSLALQASLAQRDDLAISELDWFEAVLRWTEADRSGCVHLPIATIPEAAAVAASG